MFNQYSLKLSVNIHKTITLTDKIISLDQYINKQSKYALYKTFICCFTIQYQKIGICN